MFHQCIKCSRTYTEKAPELIKGCKCGARIFLVVKNQRGSEKLAGNAAWLEKELAGLLEKHGKPISLEVENIRMQEFAKRLSLHSSFNKMGGQNGR